MKCVMCDNKKALKREHRTIKYTHCGLDNVTLIGVDYFSCPKCGEEYFNYGDQEQLHGLIAALLLKKKGPLGPKEFRFLRSYLGYSGAMFAKVSGYEPEHISRVENGKAKIMKKLDVLIRSLVANKLPDRNYDLHDWLLEEGRAPLKRIQVRSEKGHWKIAA